MSERQVALLSERAVAMLVEASARFVLGLVILWLTLRVASWAQGRVTRTLRAQRLDETLAVFFGSFARWLLVVMAVVACLGLFGIETTSVSAILGAAGLAVGLAFQGTLANFAAGVMLLAFRPFKIGDTVTAAGRTGTVAAIGIFSTAIDTSDNRRVVLPNKDAVGSVIENSSYHEARRVEIDVTLGAGADLDRARALLDETAANVPGRDADRGHEVYLASATHTGSVWQVRVWCRAEDYATVWQAATRAVRMAVVAAKMEPTVAAPVVTVVSALPGGGSGG